jgi:hypothetical protein
MFAAEIRKRRVAHMHGHPQVEVAFGWGDCEGQWQDHEGEVLEAVVTAKWDRAAPTQRAILA